MKNRSNIDFSKHVLNIRENELVSIYKLKIPNSMMLMVKFVVIEGKTLITGDFGDWIVGSGFNPKTWRNELNDVYWIDKFRTENQKTRIEKIDTESTINEIEEVVLNLEYVFSGVNLDLARKFYESLLKNVTENVLEYESFIYYSKPSFMEWSSVPCYFVKNPNLDCIFDAFEVVSNLLNKE